jgi:replicative DNA helicase
MKQDKIMQSAVRAEQSVLGAVLIDNDAMDRVADLDVDHFYEPDHKRIFVELRRQISAGKRADVISLFDAVGMQIDDGLVYLNQLAQGVPSAANIERYAQMVINHAVKRELGLIGRELAEAATGHEDASFLVDRYAAKLERLAQKKTRKEPQRLSDMLTNYVEMVQARMEGKIKPIPTGFHSLDAKLDGGFERGTLTVLAARPAMGKTAMGLCFARNVSEWGCSLFLSMEMADMQVNDRNMAALGRLPVSWLRRPPSDSSIDPIRKKEDEERWSRLTMAFQKANDLNLFIDDQTALPMFDIRAKARNVKRRQGLDLLVIDQLSFITGGDSDKSWEAVGEHTRGLLQLAKELNIAVVLLCQLNRKCEDRNNKRPMLSDLAQSGSIEQDAANVIFLYRDEVYNPDSREKGVCEVIIAKQRQGSPGVVGMAYLGDQTRFENLAHEWKPQVEEKSPRPARGFN